MKKLFKIILGATVGSTLLLSSCNFLDVDPYFEATFKEDSIFHRYLPDRYPRHKDDR